MTTLAIMQPYWFPYLGYFQLLNAADEFVIYDNIQFTKKGWVNRNRVLAGDRAEQISLPVRRASHLADIRERYVAGDWPSQRERLLNRLRSYYRKAPHFDSVYSVVRECVLIEESNLFLHLSHSLAVIKNYLEIQTPLLPSSAIECDHSLRGEERVIAICRARRADTYLNPIGGTELYHGNDFSFHGIRLRFLKMREFQYPQWGQPFVPNLSIIDVLMFNDVATIRGYLTDGYELLPGGGD